jgi:hypothetical protein
VTAPVWSTADIAIFHGACALCTNEKVQTWHNGEPCPRLVAEHNHHWPLPAGRAEPERFARCGDCGLTFDEFRKRARR